MLEATHGLNYYDLYRTNYPSSINNPMTLGAESRLKTVMVDGQEKTYKSGHTIGEYTPWLKDVKSPHVLGDSVTDYVNREDVRTAMNIPSDLPAWEECSAELEYHCQTEGSYWIYDILRGKYQILFYSGDTDSAVPTYGTQQWMNELGWDILEPSTEWLCMGEIAGYKTVRDGMTFSTIHGVGHMAPQWSPEPVQEMIYQWTRGEF